MLGSAYKKWNERAEYATHTRENSANGRDDGYDDDKNHEPLDPLPNFFRFLFGQG